MNLKTANTKHMPHSRTLSVIIPAYNKDSEVFNVVSRYHKILRKTAFDWEIIVVDDASKDKTLREAVRSKRFNGNTHRIKVYSYNLNQGKGFALYFGFKKSMGDLVLFADADLDLTIENLPAFINTFQSANTDIQIGSKRHPLSKVKYPIVRRFMSLSYQILIRSLFRLNVKDTQVGLKVFKREVLSECFPRLVVKQFAFDLELLVVANMLGYSVKEAPITLNYNFSSTIRVTSIFKILVDTAAIFYRKYLLKYYDDPKNQFEIDTLSANLFQKAQI